MQPFIAFEQRLMRWLAADYQRRVLRAGVQRAFRAFTATDPQAAASLFDEHFVRIHLLPRLYQAAQTGEQLCATTIAELWARQFSILPSTRHHYIAAIQPAATRFLHILTSELAQHEQPHSMQPRTEQMHTAQTAAR